MKSNHTKSGQQDPTSYQHTGTENKGSTFIVGRETQNQQNPAAQQSKFNTLASEEEAEQEDEEIYTDRPVKMSAGDPEGNALNIGDTDGDNEDGLEEGIEEEENDDDDTVSSEEEDEVEDDDDLAEDDELTEDKDEQDRDKF